MEISYVKHDKIDVKRWDRVVDTHGNGLPYHYSWFLDAISQCKWDALVAGDYNLIMPLVFNEKLLGVKQVYQPVLTQQLGVIGSGVTTSIIRRFLSAIPSSFKYIQFNLSHANYKLLADSDVNRVRTNYILDLSDAEEDILNRFDKGLRKKVKKYSGVHKVEYSQDVAELTDFYEHHLESTVKWGKHNYVKAFNLLQAALNRNMLSIVRLSVDGQITCIASFIITSRRIINVFGASSAYGRSQQSMSVALYEIIRKYALTDRVLDFEGSDVPGVRLFFKSFGGENEPYAEYKKDNLPFLFSLLKHKRLKW